MERTTASASRGRSRWVAPAVLGVIALIAAACGSSTSPSQAASEIEYSIWGDPAELASQQAIVDAFHAANPDVTVKVTVSDWDAYWTKLETGLAGGAAPDVFAMDGPLFHDYQTRDVLLDLKPSIDKDKYDLSQLADQGVADFTTADGGQYGLPRDLNTVVLYYNKAMFDAAGLPYPDDTWDWAKLVEVGKKLTLDTNGDGTPDQWGLYTETGDMENAWLSFVWENGGDVLAADGKSTVVDSPEAAGGIQFLQDLIYKDKIVDPTGITVDQGDGFENGRAAMEINGSWLVPTHTAAGLDFGIAPIPSGPKGRVTSVNPTGAVVYKGSKSPEAAWRFVKYLASPEAQTKLMELKAALPVSKEVLEGAYSTSFDGAKVFADSLSYAKLKPSFAGYNEFNTMLQGELDKDVFLAQNKTAQDALTTIAPALNEFLSSR
jgi:multiple sugar transport system substrate-binding protein